MSKVSRLRASTDLDWTRARGARPLGPLSGVVFCASLALSPPSGAALGGNVASVQSDQVQMRATRQLANRAGFEVHELALASGTVVREFASTTGTVFAVAWQGPTQPDLRQLLGEHFPRLAVADPGAHRDHRALTLRYPDLVIESGGKMRSFAGRAYLPALVPAGLAVGDIR